MPKDAITTAGRETIIATEALRLPRRERGDNRSSTQRRAPFSRIARKLGQQARPQFAGASPATDRILTVTATASVASPTEVGELGFCSHYRDHW